MPLDIRTLLPEISAYVEAEAIEGRTMVGCSGDFPRKHGNCFSMTADGMRYRILNFNGENMDELLRRGEIEYPVRLGVYGRGTLAVVCDPRIPDEWYADHICETCCPHEMLPLNQRLRIAREIEDGRREYTSTGGCWMGLRKTKEGLFLPT